LLNYDVPQPVIFADSVAVMTALNVWNPPIAGIQAGLVSAQLVA